ncbi:MAG: hypothetical protein CMM56_00220 [Rhodospirillaceae bacterium]|nr:hypothetical protein [Rhodospirillaceae bacterium]
MSTPRALVPETNNPLGESADRGFTLPASYYTDQAIYELEKENIFYRSWQYVCHESNLTNPGDYATKQIADENIFVIRDDNGTLRGFYNVCRHRAHQLLQGRGNSGRIVCPYHAWAYSRSGELTFARNSELVTDFDAQQFCLRAVNIENFLGFIFVNLSETVEPLNSLAADLYTDIREKIPYIDQLSLKEPSVFGGNGIRAGWKVVVDNYLECYHCANAHLDFSDIIDMNCYQMDTFGLWSRQIGTKTKPQNSAYPFSSTDQQQDAVFWYLWPNTTLFSLPGTPNLSVMSIDPMDADYSIFAGDIFGLDNYELNDSRINYVNVILGPEDQRLCESVQLGLRSRSYNQGRFIVNSKHLGTAEHAVHQFHMHVFEALESSSQ